MQTIMIFGGNGFLGTSLSNYFQKSGHKVIIVSRKPVPTSGLVAWRAWDGKTAGEWTTDLDKTDVVINLAGKNVDCRYTEKNKAAIYSSRLDSTKTIGEAIRRCQHPPKVWLNASSATIYKASYDRLMTEQHGDIGDDFSMDVCKRWEATVNEFNDVPTRRVLMRISIVLGWDGAALPALANLVRYRIGGHQGDGRQMCSWIHINDFCRAVDWLINNGNGGAYNVTAPIPIPNRQFMCTLRKNLGVSFGLPSPKWLLELGAFFLRTETELVLKSRKVYPKRLLDEGFIFKYETLESALADLVRPGK